MIRVNLLENRPECQYPSSRVLDPNHRVSVFRCDAGVYIIVRSGLRQRMIPVKSITNVKRQYTWRWRVVPLASLRSGK